MRALLVDPESKTVTETDVSGDLESLQKAVGGYIEGIYPGNFHPALRGVHGYVDEEGLFKEKARHSWSLPGYSHLVGPGVFLCDNGAGDESPCTLPVEVLRALVAWK